MTSYLRKYNASGTEVKIVIYHDDLKDWLATDFVYKREEAERILKNFEESLVVKNG